ncbi:UNVERIFIED_CONTAM: hypothetical protein HDU68_011321 [Siphonaria sp. JEL0065]|nr:hypothetical protein HDU68_011321 [Siphonaria sp. JEL0065]
MNSIVVLALATFAAAQSATRCGITWDDANANCANTVCVFPDAICPSGQHCFADVAASCGGPAAQTTSVVPPTVVAPVPSSAPAVATSTGPVDVVAQVSALFAQAPACLLPCVAGNSTTITQATIVSLCQANSTPAGANATAVAVSTCIQSSCSAADQAAATTALASSAATLLSVCQSLAAAASPSASASKTVSAASSAGATTAQFNNTANGDAIALGVICGIIGLLVLIALIVFCCCNRVKKVKPEEK